MTKAGLVTPDRWQQIEKLYDVAVRSQPSDRHRLLYQWCAGDDELRREVEWMLAHREEAGRFMKTSALEAAARSLASASLVLPPDSPSVLHTRTKRRRWWMYLIGASFIALNAFWLYLGPFDLEGLDARFQDGAMRIRSLRAGTQLMQGGLRPGDLVLSIGNLPVRSVREWTAAQANLETGKPQKWEVIRGTEPVDLILTLERDARGWAHIGYAFLYFGFVSLGLFVGFKRPDDLVARIGSVLFMTMSIIFGLQNGWAAAWRQVLPIPIQVLLWIPEVCRFVIDGIFLSFFVTFPRRMFSARWPWLLIWAPVLLTLPWRVWGFYSIIYRPGLQTGVPGWVNGFTGLRTMAYLVAAFVVLIFNYRRLTDLNERRRIRIILIGTLVTLMAAFPTVWIYSFWGYGLGFNFVLWAAVFIPLTLACPFAFAYAIMRHRIFDIQVIIRQGLQYALARRAVLGVVPAVGVFLISDLAINSSQPLANIIRARGWIYGGLSGLAILTYCRRREWLETLDRRFFRERYNAQQVLRDVAKEIRQAKSFDRVAARVVARIESALHPEFVSIMVRASEGPEYRSLASVPSGEVLPRLSADSKLLALAAVLGRPLEVLLGDSEWLVQRLPEKEIELARRSRLDLLVPITLADHTEALLVLGIKRSEEPYTHEDQELLEAIASSLAVLLEQPFTFKESVAKTMAECPRCGLCCENNAEVCPADAAVLTPVQLPRTLANRYRLERRRGTGGMGTIYEAVDVALHRRVAVKVVREDLLGSDDAERRFGRESRVVAAFSHPNVVTVYDYGVENRRVFLVMELLTGSTLRDELKARKRLDPLHTVEIFRGICAATDAAHRRHLIHRDLKPENIFLSSSDNGGGNIVKVLDFGIAKFLPAYDADATTSLTLETRVGALVGTPAYMSPEQLLGARPDPSWDLWSLAVVAYESLSGATPFSNSDCEGTPAILTGNFTPLTVHLPFASQSWQTFFEECFAIDRSRRPSSVSEFFDRFVQMFA